MQLSLDQFGVPHNSQTQPYHTFVTDAVNPQSKSFNTISDNVSGWNVNQ